jgi:hypothetical protein
MSPQSGKSSLDYGPLDLDLHRLLQQHAPRKMLKSWLMKGQVRCFGSVSRVDSEKAGAVRILKRRVFCHVQMALVSAVDVSCYAWKPREPAGASDA